MFNLTWFRSFRLFGYSAFDTLLTIVGVLVLGPLLSKLFRYLHLDIPLKSWFLLSIPLGFIVHLATKTYTPLTLQLLDVRGHYLSKIVVVTLAVLGLLSIKVLKTK